MKDDNNKDSIDITGIDKAELLAALYNGFDPAVYERINYRHRAMTREEAQQEINANPSMDFDYLHGRVMKILIRGNRLDARRYNENNGEGIAQNIVATIRAGLPSNYIPMEEERTAVRTKIDDILRDGPKDPKIKPDPSDDLPPH